MVEQSLVFHESLSRRGTAVIDFVKKNTWVVLVVAFVALVVAGIMMS
jgi:hypothetical protein